MSRRARVTARRYWADPEGFAGTALLERPETRPNAVDRLLVGKLAVLRARLTPRKLPRGGLPEAVISLGESFERVPDAILAARAASLRPRLLRDGFQPQHLCEAFALLRESTRRSLGLAQRPVQIYGAAVLLRGSLLEMATGEGKTITAALAAGTAALAGLHVHVVTVNDYLAERDCTELEPIFARLGLTVGLIVNGMPPRDRRAAYAADIVYVNNKEVTFDYLRDRLTLGERRSRPRAKLLAAVGRADRMAAAAELIQRGLDFAIIDEADSVLIDEARTPLIISSESGRPDDMADYNRALALAGSLQPGQHYEVNDRDRAARLTPSGRAEVARLSEGVGGLWAVRRAREERITQAISALRLFRRDEHYILVDDKVQIVDEFTGRVMPDRSWEAGLHQMIEAHEGVPLTGRRTTIARITYQRFFRRYRRLSGMTGTGVELTGELAAEYGLRTRRVATHRPVQRRFLHTRLFRTADDKWQAVIGSVAAMAARGRPVLIGVRSVRDSQTLSAALDAAGHAHVVLNARQDADEAAIVARAGQPGAITVATNMAGRGTDIKLGPGVAAAGGLHVILTEFHESSRIDRQLYGRAGRQGDPGSCEAVVSLDDELFVNYAATPRRLLAGLPHSRNGALWGAGAVLLRWIAQRRAERNNAEIRALNLRQDREQAKMLAFAGREE